MAARDVRRAIEVYLYQRSVSDEELDDLMVAAIDCRPKMHQLFSRTVDAAKEHGPFYPGKFWRDWCLFKLYWVFEYFDDVKLHMNSLRLLFRDTVQLWGAQQPGVSGYSWPVNVEAYGDAENLVFQQVTKDFERPPGSSPGLCEPRRLKGSVAFLPTLSSMLPPADLTMTVPFGFNIETEQGIYPVKLYDSPALLYFWVAPSRTAGLSHEGYEAKGFVVLMDDEDAAHRWARRAMERRV